MMRPACAVLLSCLALAGEPLLAPLLAPLPARAEDQTQSQVPPPGPSDKQTTPGPGPGEAGRFTFHRAGDSFLRLDSSSGQVSQCASNATGWSCNAVPDERAALESEIGRLQRENAMLKGSLLARGLDLPGGVRGEAKPVPPASIPDTSPGAPREPGEAEIDRAIAYMKQVWRKLVDMMLDLQRDIQRKS